VAVKNSVKVGPLVFLLKMFVIMENIMKCPVFYGLEMTGQEVAFTYFKVLSRCLFRKN